MADQTRPLAFVDIETTGLHPFVHEITEVGLVLRQTDGSETEHVWYPQHSLETADEKALELTRYEQRIAPQPKQPLVQVMSEFAELTEGATIVGANTSFDVTRLEWAAHRAEVAPKWHHRIRNVEDLASPHMGTTTAADVPSLARAAKALGVTYDSDAHHGALYDAHLAAKVFDAAAQKSDEHAATAEELPKETRRRLHAERHARPHTAIPAKSDNRCGAPNRSKPGRCHRLVVNGMCPDHGPRPTTTPAQRPNLPSVEEIADFDPFE